jgi:hypothetical protein
MPYFAPLAGAGTPRIESHAVLDIGIVFLLRMRATFYGSSIG